MSLVQDDITSIEASMDDAQPLSVVRGLDQLTALRHAAAAADARRVDLALCRWWHVLDEHETYRDRGAILAADPEASVLEQSWGRYWQAHARAHLVDGPEPAIDAYLPILDALTADLSAEATDLGNRLWNPMSRLWDDARFLAAYVPWAKPRIAQADEADQWEIVRRVRDHADSLSETEPVAAIGWFEELAGWELPADRPGWAMSLHSRVGRLRLATHDPSRAREAFLRAGALAAADPELADTVPELRILAARALADTGQHRAAADELRRWSAPAPGDPDWLRGLMASGRVALVRVLLEIDPASGDREAVAMWREAGDDPDPEVAHQAGLAFALSWDALEDVDQQEAERRMGEVIASNPTPRTAQTKTLVTLALNSRTRLRENQGDRAGALADSAHAVELADDDVPEHVRATTTRNAEALRLREGDYTRRDDIYPVVRQLVDAADTASASGDANSSARDYWRAFELANTSPDTATRVAGVVALTQLTTDLLARRDDLEAARIARIAVEHRVEDGSSGTEQLATAWLQLGIATNRLADRASATYAFDQAVTLGESFPAVASVASQAAWNRAVMLDDGRAPEAAVAAYRAVIAGTPGTAGPDQQRRVAKALWNGGVVLADELHRPADALAWWQDLLTRFEASPDPELMRLVGQARAKLPPPRKRGLFGRRP